MIGGGAQTVGVLRSFLHLDTKGFQAGVVAANAGLRTFERSVHRSNILLSNFSLAISGVGLSYMAAEAVMAGEEMINLERRLRVITNSINKNTSQTADSAETLDWLRETALRTGTAFGDLNKAYIQLVPMAVANRVAQDEIRDAIVGTIGAATLMGATNRELSRSFIAIRQVIGKNQLQMEELRGQLGEAMPNAMLILTAGLNQLRDEGFKDLQQQAEVTTQTLNKMIVTGQIDAEMFIKAWARGTEQFRKFAELRSFMVSGQFENTLTILETRIGNFINRSGLNTYAASWIAEMNAALDDFFNVTDERAQEMGDAFRTEFERVALVIAGFIDDTLDFNTEIIDAFLNGIGAAWDGVNTIIGAMPPVMREIGLFGFLLLGTKGKALVLGSAAILQSIIDSMPDDVKQRFQGAFRDLSLTSRQADYSGAMRANESDSVPFDNERRAQRELNDLLVKEFGERASDLSGDLLGTSGLSIEDRLDITERLIGASDSAELDRELVNVKEALLSRFQHSKELVEEENSVRAKTKEILDRVNARYEEQAETLRASLAKDLGATMTELGEANPFQLLTGNQQLNLMKYMQKGMGFLGSPGGASIANTLNGFQSDYTRIFGYQRADGTQAPGDADKMNAALPGSANATILGFGVETMDKLANVTGESTLAKLKEQREARLQGIELVVSKLREAGVAEADIQERVTAAKTKLQTEYAEHVEKISARLYREQQRAAQDAIASAKALGDIGSRALDAMIEKATNSELFKARAQQEAVDMRFGKLDPEAAVYNVIEAKREQLAIDGMITDALNAQLSAQIRANIVLDEGVQRAMVQRDITQRVTDEKLRQADIARELAVLDNPEARRQMLNTELRALDLEYQNLQLKLELANTDAYASNEMRMQMLEMEMESRRLEIEMMTLRDEQMVRRERELEIQREQVELQRLYNDYTMSLGDYMATNMVSSAQTLSNALSQGIFDWVTGMKSAEEVWKGLLKTIIGGIIEMFATWIAQQAVAFLMQQLGLLTTMATAGATASASLAMWTPAAIAASIATFGAASAVGLSAFMGAMASGSAIGLLGGVMQSGTFASGPVAGGGVPGGMAVLHEGGVFGMKRPLKSNEGFALLEEGELVVPTENTAATIRAMQMAGIPLPKGVRDGVYHDGGVYGNVGTSADYVDSDSFGKGMEVVNYFDWNDVDRHMQRNPDAVLNIVTENNRNNGRVRRMIRSGSK